MMLSELQQEGRTPSPSLRKLNVRNAVFGLADGLMMLVLVVSYMKHTP